MGWTFAVAGIPANVGLRGYDAKVVSIEARSPGGGESMVQQQFAEEVDINTIVRRFGLTREWPMNVVSEAVYGDFTGITDYDSALATISRTEERFMQLPAEVRDQFKNDPAELVRLAQGKSPEEFQALFEKPADVVVPPVVVGEPSNPPA